MPEAQRTQGIDSRTRVISPAKKNANSVEKKIQVKDWRYLHQFGHQVLSSSAKVTSVKSQQPLSVSLRDPDPYIGPRIPGSNDNRLVLTIFLNFEHKIVPTLAKSSALKC